MADEVRLNDDNLEAEQAWCIARREEVRAYLEKEQVAHGRIGEWPVWHVAPHVSVWAVESGEEQDVVGWWVLCGEMPTDYLPAAGVDAPREVVRIIAEDWREMAEFMLRGEEEPEKPLGGRESWPELGPVLLARAELLLAMVENPALWETP